MSDQNHNISKEQVMSDVNIDENQNSYNIKKDDQYGDLDVFFHIFDVIPGCIRSQFILENHKDYAIIAVSPYNSYFSVEKIKLHIHWVRKNFKDFYIYYPSKLHINNLIAKGYSTQHAKKKSQKQDKDCLNRIVRAAAELGISQEKLESHLLTTEKLEYIPSYHKALDKIYTLYENDIEFNSSVNKMLKYWFGEDEMSSEIIKYAKVYLLSEIAVVSHGTNILNIPSSLFVYHNTILSEIVNSIAKSSLHHNGMIALRVNNIKDKMVHFLDNIHINIYAKDIYGKYMFANKKMCHYTTILQSDILNKNDYQFGNSKYVQSVIENDQYVIKNKITTEVEEPIKLDYLHTDEISTFLSVKSPLYDENQKVIGIVGASTNISELKVAQKKLKEEYEQKRRYSDILSHEVRGPSTAASLLVEDLLKNWDSISDYDKKSRLETVNSAVMKINHITQNVYNLSVINSNNIKISIKKYDFQEIVEQEINMARTVNGLTQDQLIFEVQGKDFTSYCDKFYISLAIANLISNAIKFGGRGNVKVVLYRLSDDHTHAFKVDVIDEGPGIPEGQSRKIFEAEQRGDNHNAAGLGIGLFLARKIARLHKGEIVGVNNVEKGCTFSLVIPHKDLELDAEFENTRKVKYQNEKIRIVTIDDEFIIQKVLQLILDQEKFEIKRIRTGTEGFEYLNTNYKNIDLCLLDFNLPDINADVIINKLKDNPSYETIKKKIVIQTGRSDIGIEGYRVLHKPYNYDQVIRVITDVIHNH